MPKLSFVFFKNALVVASFCGALLLRGLAFAETSVESLLELPEYQLESVVSAENETQTFTVGDEMSIRFSSEMPVESVDLPEGSSTFSELGWQIYRKEISQKPGEYEWALSPLKAGDLLLPPMLLRNKDGKTFGRTAPFKAKIGSNLDPSLAEKEQPAPARPPVPVEFPRWLLFLITVGSVAVLLIMVYLLRRFFKNRKKSEVHEPVVTDLSCEQVALQALAILENEDWSTPDKAKMRTFRLTEIMKAYMERKFGFDAVESTTTEILAKLKKSGGLPDGVFINMAELLVDMDRIKFTDFGANLAQSSDLIGRSKTWVRSTSILNPLGGPRL